MAARDIIVIGGSAGGFEALTRVLPELPVDLEASVFVALHRPLPSAADDFDYLPSLLKRKAPFDCVAAVDGQVLRKKTLYVAPRGAHLLFEGERVRVADARKLPTCKTVDSLFHAASLNFEARVIAVLLTGMLDDGTAGLWDVRRRGGITIVQDPASADHPGMPGSALFHGSPHYCLPLSAIAETLGRLVSDTEALGRERRKPRVLIVEDEAVVALNLEERLGDLGYEVVGAMSSGEEAVRLAAEVCPDIVLMDVHLSGTMTGTEAGRVLWERHALPIVYLTAYSDEGTLAETKASMPYGFIVKPYRPAQIQAALKLALDRREREISRAG